MPYLDEKGLAYLWGNVKNYVDNHSGSGGGVVEWGSINGRPDLSNISSMRTVPVVLQSALWVDNRQIVLINGIVSDEQSQLVIAKSRNSDRKAYHDAGIDLISQYDGALEFDCQTVPNDDVHVNIFIFGAVEVAKEFVGEFIWWSPHMTSDTAPVPYVASASSAVNGAHPYKAFDGVSGVENNWDNYWYGDSPENQWIQLDFGKKEYVSGIRIFPISTQHTGNGWMCIPKEIRVLGSNDGGEWEIVFSSDGNDSPEIRPNEYKEYIFDKPYIYRFFRIMQLINYRGDEVFLCTEIQFLKLEGNV